MTVTLDLTPELEARLKAAAEERGLTEGKMVEQILQDGLAGYDQPRARLTVEAFHAFLEEMAKGSENLPVIPTEAFTRASFYPDRW